MGQKAMNQPATCERCGNQVLPDAVYCARCGHPIERPYRHARYNPDEPISSYNGLVALLLCLFVGYLGIHRFYVGKIGTGILWLCTGGLFGVGWVIDLVLIACGRFRDFMGYRLTLGGEQTVVSRA
jgi:ribosomal protein L37E